MRCTFRDKDQVRCAKAEGHVSPHRCVSYLDDKPGAADALARVQMVSAQHNPNRTHLLAAAAAEAELASALEQLTHAMDHIKAIGFAPIVIEHVSRSKSEALIAITQISALIKRMP